MAQLFSLGIMKIVMRFCFLLVFWILTGIGCRHLTPHEIEESSITGRFARTYIHPLSDPIALLAHNGRSIPPELLRSNRVTLVEIIPKKGERRTLFEDESQRPPNDGMTTGVEHAYNIGLFFPETLSQREIEVRVNYGCDIGDSVAVHVVVPNPLVLTNRP